MPARRGPRARPRGHRGELLRARPADSARRPRVLAPAVHDGLDPAPSAPVATASGEDLTQRASPHERRSGRLPRNDRPFGDPPVMCGQPRRIRTGRPADRHSTQPTSMSGTADVEAAGSGGSGVFVGAVRRSQRDRHPDGVARTVVDDNGFGAPASCHDRPPGGPHPRSDRRLVVAAAVVRNRYRAGSSQPGTAPRPVPGAPACRPRRRRALRSVGTEHPVASPLRRAGRSSPVERPEAATSRHPSC